MAKRLGAAHGQCRRRLQLPFGNGLDTGADDFGGIGTQVDHHGQHRGLPFRQAHPQRGQAKEDEEQLHDEGRVTDQLHVHAEQHIERFEPPGTRHSAKYAQGYPEQGAHCGQLEREQRPLSSRSPWASTGAKSN